MLILVLCIKLNRIKYSDTLIHKANPFFSKHLIQRFNHKTYEVYFMNSQVSFTVAIFQLNVVLYFSSFKKWYILSYILVLLIYIMVYTYFNTKCLTMNKCLLLLSNIYIYNIYIYIIYIHNIYIYI